MTRKKQHKKQTAHKKLFILSIVCLAALKFNYWAGVGVSVVIAYTYFTNYVFEEHIWKEQKQIWIEDNGRNQKDSK